MKTQTTAKSFHTLRRERVACDETFQLNAVGIEVCSERLGQLLEQMDVERQNRIRIR